MIIDKIFNKKVTVEYFLKNLFKKIAKGGQNF